MAKKVLASMLLILLAGSTALGQAREQDETIVQLNFISALPQGELAEHLDRSPLGTSLFFGGRVPGLPVVLATELGLLHYGLFEQLELHSIQQVPVAAVHVATSHNIATGHFVVRLQQPVGPLQPYLDILAGLKHFITRTRIESDVVIFREGLSATTHVSDWALSYGVGGGLDLHLFTRPVGIEQRQAAVSLNVGLRYTFGPEATYVQAGSVREENGRFTFDAERARTDLVIPLVGMRVKL